MNYLLNLENTEWRYERKYVFEAVLEPKVELEIKQSRHVFNTAYPPRWVNNVYFDTKSLASFFANINGSDQRIKCRIRWYGDFDSAHPEAVLEFKVKNGLAGTKLLYPLKNFSSQKLGSLLDLRACFSESELPESIRSYLLFVEPVLINRYYRKYYLSFNRKFRLTLDRNIGFASMIVKADNKSAAMQRSDEIVVELKYDNAAAMDVLPVFEGLASRLSRNSKYVNSLSALYPNLNF